VIYRDFFQFNLPGTQLFYAILIRVLGSQIWIPNLCLLGLGLALFWTSVDISRHLVRGPAAVLPGLMFLCLSFNNYLDATHHWYSVLLIMLAMALLKPASKKEIRFDRIVVRARGMLFSESRSVGNHWFRVCYFLGRL
jgi:hypothetical protein